MVKTLAEEAESLLFSLPIQCFDFQVADSTGHPIRKYMLNRVYTLVP